MFGEWFVHLIVHSPGFPENHSDSCLFQFLWFYTTLSVDESFYLASITFPLSSKSQLFVYGKHEERVVGGAVEKDSCRPSLPVLESCPTEWGGGRMKVRSHKAGNILTKNIDMCAENPRREELLSMKHFSVILKICFVSLTLKLFTLVFKF